jgi:hypothetical protein
MHAAWGLEMWGHWFENVKGRDDLDLRRKLEGNIKTGLQKIVCV